jgi:hypothetical protein
MTTSSKMEETEMEKIAYCKIHPAIGIARVGNHPTEYFIGPEKPFEPVDSGGGFKAPYTMPDGTEVEMIKRQAARFRIFAYDENHEVIGEITKEDAHIEWKVSLANKKASWEKFIGLNRTNETRNPGVDKDELEITPDPQTIDADSQETKKFDNGYFLSHQVPLGEIRVDEEGRLLVLGGYGKAESPNGDNITNYANNPGWYDDVSDGPVTAIVHLKENDEPIEVKGGSWVICAPPDYAPEVHPIVSGFDLLIDRAYREGKISLPVEPSWYEDILPILESALNMTNVVKDEDFGTVYHTSFSPIIQNMGLGLRKFILSRIRVPKGKLRASRLGTSDGNMPLLRDDNNEYSEDGTVDQGFTVTERQYLLLEKWADGLLDTSTSDLSEEITPHGLDRAALERCCGGAFYPGIEFSWFVRDEIKMMDQDFLRIDQSQLLFGKKISAGDITKQLAVPWQADFLDCTLYPARDGSLPAWWPAARPNHYVNMSGVSVEWGDDIDINQNGGTEYFEMVEHWWKLGFVINE